jgi:Fur family zinc uptake transcriptional regulator
MTLCSHHSHDDHLHGVHEHGNVNARILAAEQTCIEQGVRLTPLRKEVLSLILSANAPVGAYDLLAKIKSKTERPAAPPTVYRTLDFLLQYGFVHRLTSINAFIPCCHPREGHQAAFLICQKCHTVQETSANNLFHELEYIAAEGQFQAQHSIIEISGICLQCQ